MKKLTNFQKSAYFQNIAKLSKIFKCSKTTKFSKIPPKIKNRQIAHESVVPSSVLAGFDIYFSNSVQLDRFFDIILQVKTESLMEEGRQGMSDNISEASSADREQARALAAAAAAVAAVTTSSEEHKPTAGPPPSNNDHFLSAFHSNGLQQHEHEARVEALQVIKAHFI